MEEVQNTFAKGLNHLQAGLVKTINLTLAIKQLDDSRYMKLIQELAIYQNQTTIHDTVITNHLHSLYNEDLNIINVIADLTRNLIQLGDVAFYSSILSSCQNFRFPLSLITPTQLKEYLVEVNNELANKEQELAWELENLSLIYSTPNVQCRLSNHNHMLQLALWLPVKPLNNKYKLFKGYSVDFKF